MNLPPATAGGVHRAVYPTQLNNLVPVNKPPDLIVAVELSISSTGTNFEKSRWRLRALAPNIVVAGPILDGDMEIRCDWPASTELETNSAPTALVYFGDNTVLSWGYIGREAMWLDERVEK